jgi:hypothetical protein
LGGRNPQLKQNFAEAGYLTTKQVAQEVGFGNKETYRQAKYISENASESTLLVVRTNFSINIK